MTCLDTIQAYAFRSLGFGEKALPTSDFTLCHQATLIGSGMLWNIYFGALALLAGFFLAVAVLYTLSGPTGWLWGRLHRSGEAPAAEPPAPP